MLINCLNVLVYLCCGSREETEQEQTHKHIVKQEYNELVE